jgi:hypothetical protein
VPGIGNSWAHHPTQPTPIPSAGGGHSSRQPSDRLFESSLAALVNAGALDHVDLVLPTVPNRAEANRYSMRFCATNQAVIYATGDYPLSRKFRTAGNPPLHLNIWYKHEEKGSVQALIDGLEQMSRKSP